MPIFIATLSLQATAHDYAPLWRALDSAGAQCLMDTTWLIDVAQDVIGVTDALLSHCRTGDKAFILEFVPGAAWTGTGLGPESKAWMARRMPIAKPPSCKRSQRPSRHRVQSA